MINLNSFAKLDGLPDFGLRKVEDLVFFDGPLLTEFRSSSNEPFLAYWVDSDEHCNRWMYLRADEPRLVRMKMRQLAMERVIPFGAKDGFVYFVDIDESGFVATSCQLVYVKDIPLEYQPEKAAMLPQLSTALQSSPNLTIAIDGEWEYKEWAKFPKEMAFAYAFALMEKVQGITDYPTYSWRHKGGFSPGHFGNWITAKVTGSDRLDTKSVQYASPGFIRYRLNSEGRAILLGFISHYQKNRESIRAADSALVSYIKSKNLDAVNSSGTAGQDEKLIHDQPLRELSMQLWQSMAQQSMGTDMSKKIEDAYSFAHITRWFCRRLEALDAFVRRGLVTFPE